MTAPELRADRASGKALMAALGVPTFVAKSTVVRDFVRSVLVPDSIGRLYDIGHGIAEFDTIVDTPDGQTIVAIEAPPSVQVAALRALVDIGLPRQLGIVDGADRELPGVFYLGGPGLDKAREVAGAFTVAERATETALSPDMEARVAAGEFEMVEVEEGEAQIPDADRPDPPLPTEPTLEQEILARRRSKSNGTNGNGTYR